MVTFLPLMFIVQIYILKLSLQYNEVNNKQKQMRPITRTNGN